ncbi:cadmium-translocating P-type ATPase [Thomasclavelia cocleata]|uniref:Cd(2+)-exporting ATPase n=1 Tax=Thomasclavelia cocleata TaxID=69824 RepID=A0A1I0H9U5_9FIRM|nr:heavy metal translocating P-type ATPase [Thomasclavelia cocleata]MCR1959999.1 heavy metal translocating P-type ATPase [Thomasclavelia cocleata]NDO41658.1 cadmium-translocating P-type ATPase [Thomasclavelia cocleata]PJN79699.1 cadmium-translocating P-type ATPase [Thomasclavelia cocleata]SET79656.1 Cd2+/Zn2+-exporting ATPase [Thomasclavelia cocleata]
MKLKYDLKGLDCANCAQKVQERVSDLKGIKECNVVFATTKMFVETIDDSFDEALLIKTVKSVEPDVEVINLSNEFHDDKIHHHNHNKYSCEHDHEHHHKHENCSCGHDHDIETIKHDDLKEGINIKISGLDCANCAMKVEQAINKMNEIDKAQIIFSTETLKVKPKDSIDQNKLLKQIQKVVDQVEDGVTLSLKDTLQVIEKPRLFVCKDHLGLIIGTLIYIIAIIVGDFEFDALIYGIAYLLVGYKVILKALKNIGRGEIFDENFLMCIATIGAFCISDYKEAIAVMLFYSVGEIFQAYAVNKTRTSISSLMDLKSDYANLIVGDDIIKVTPEKIKIGDEIIIKVGEKVPLDGKVLKGESTLDTSSLTGETLPRNVSAGDEVLAGVVNLTGIINIKVTQAYEDSTVSKILDLVENAASKKAPIEQFITRFARVYTPTVVFLAIALAVIPMIIFKDAVFLEWLYRALTFLVVSCPCALVISIPLGLYAGLGKASKMGALVKGGNYLELLKDIDTVVFDKTGTLTEGSFEVIEINGSDDLLMLGAYGESMSNHPIAKSVVKKYGQVIDQKRISDFKEVAGKGIEVKIDGKLYNLGNKSYIEGLGIQVQNPLTVGTVIHIVCQRKYLGNIVVADKIKDTTIEGIKRLKKEGIQNTVMLTGDRREVAKDIAKKIGIDTVYSELLPQDKVMQVENLINQGARLSFVGDGINDAPVLARADLGIAMGGVGSDAAIEAADIVLMNDDIITIGEAISISKKTNKVLKQNVIFTLIIKIGVLLLTMFGCANMWMGVFADVGVTLIAILNSMRILK